MQVHPTRAAMIFWASVLAWALAEAWIFARDRRAATGKSADRGTLGLLMVVFPLTFWGAFRIATWSQIHGNVLRFPGPGWLPYWLGIGLVWTGIGLRSWSVLTLGAFFRTTVFLQDEHRLITRGPYRVLRNPSYAGGLMSISGIGLALGAWPSAVIMAVGALAGYAVRLLVEEKALRARFGEAYDAYARRTWRLIPLVW